MENFSVTIEKLEAYVRDQADAASDPAEMSYLFKECINVVEELCNLETSYLHVLHGGQIGAGPKKSEAAAFTQVLEDRKRAGTAGQGGSEEGEALRREALGADAGHGRGQPIHEGPASDGAAAGAD